MSTATASLAPSCLSICGDTLDSLTRRLCDQSLAGSSQAIECLSPLRYKPRVNLPPGPHHPNPVPPQGGPNYSGYEFWKRVLRLGAGLHWGGVLHVPDYRRIPVIRKNEKDWRRRNNRIARQLSRWPCSFTAYFLGLIGGVANGMRVHVIAASFRAILGERRFRSGPLLCRTQPSSRALSLAACQNWARSW
jgi:hypothetical protein